MNYLNKSEMKKQWHEGFYGAIEMELREDADNLQFDIEHYLGKEPFRMDMLIIKQLPDCKITNEIGHIFKKYNIIEYKSPKDGLSIDDYVKTVGYASLYKALADKTDGIAIEDISITLVRDGYPKKLMKKLEDIGCKAITHGNGIYHIIGNVMYSTQIIVTNQLDKKHTWLRVLTDKAKLSDLEKFSLESCKVATQGEQNNISAIYQISVMANREIYEEMKRRNPMQCSALMELMKPEIEERERQATIRGISQGISQGIKSLVATVKKLHGTKPDAVESIMNEYGKNEAEAKELVDKYW